MVDEARKRKLGWDSEELCVLKLRNRNVIQNVTGSIIIKRFKVGGWYHAAILER